MLITLFLSVAFMCFSTAFSEEADVYRSKTSDDYVNCERGWYYFRDKCYVVGGRRLPYTWANALSICKGVGADLVSIQSQEEQDFIVAYLQLDVKWWAWTGLNDREKEGDWKWSDGSVLNYTNWRPNEPSGSGLEEYSKRHDEDCILLTYNTVNDFLGKWNDRKCDAEEYAFCEKQSNPRKRSPNLKYCSPAEGGGWKYENSCFHIVTRRETWKNAEKHCEIVYKGHLLTIQDTLQDVFLELALPDIQEDVWIGIKIQSELQQKWTSGWYVAYERFSKEERYEQNTCVARKNRKEWITIPCSEQLPFICEVSKAIPPVLKPPPKGADCPKDFDDWRDLGGDYCYYIDQTSVVDFSEANYECQRRGAHLLSLHSPEETDILKPFMQHGNENPEYNTGFVIGLLRLKAYNEETFGWTDGSELDYRNWDYGQPNSLEGKCVEIRRRSMRWNDMSCKNKAPGFICTVKKIITTSSLVEESNDCASFCISPTSYLHGMLSQCEEVKPISCKKN